VSQIISLGVQGLITHTSELTSGEGALRVADNIVINKPGVAEMVRGFAQHKTIDAVCRKLISHQGRLSNDYELGLSSYNGSLRSVHAGSKLYVATSQGVVKLEDSRPIFAGVAKALDITISLADKRGFLPKDQQVAYRVVWGYRDSKQTLILGAPSQRATIRNETSDARQVHLEFPIPPGITEKHFYQIYRSEVGLDASDELSLIIQQNPTLEELISNQVSITDNAPRSLSGASLYTNETQEGVLQSNDRPPIAHELALFKDCLFFGNTRGNYRLFLTLESIGSPDGLSVGDVLTLGDTAFKASNVEDLTHHEFHLSSDVSSRGISETLASLIKVINHSNSGFHAYSFETSEDPDDIGKVLIESSHPFCVQISSHSGAFSPVLPQQAQCDEMKSAVAFSKYQQPEAVPAMNYFQCGSSENEVLRLIPLRESLFCMTTEGVFRINGSSPESFIKELFDSSLKLLAPESPAVLSNHIISLTNQGVVAISDSGVSVLSNPIKDIIQAVTSPEMLEATKRLAFGVAYESESKYFLFLPSKFDDKNCTQALVYNFLTNTWTRLSRSATHAIIHPTEDKLYLCLENQILEERKHSENDYLDEHNQEIESRLEWQPNQAGNPFTLKQWSEVSLHFKKRGACKLSFSSDLSSATEEFSILEGNPKIRTYTPAQKQFASALTIGLTTTKRFELQGISLIITGVNSERVSR